MLNPPLWLSVLVWVPIPLFFAVDFVASRRRQRSRPAHPPTGRVAVTAAPSSRPGVAVTALDLAAAGVLVPLPGVTSSHRCGPELSPAHDAGDVGAAGRAAAPDQVVAAHPGVAATHQPVPACQGGADGRGAILTVRPVVAVPGMTDPGTAPASTPGCPASEVAA